MKRAIAAATFALAARATTAHAFCGFYVSGSGDKMFNDATQVVLVRDGTRTVLSMQNDYQGPLEDFAMVVPVPVVLHDGDVKTLSKEVFEHVDALGAPRLVEYWEQDPCPQPRGDDDSGVRMKGMAIPAAAESAYAGGGDKDMRVKIEAQFTAGE